MDKRNDVWLCLKVKDQNDNMSKTTVVKINDHEFISKKRYQQLEQVARDMWEWIDGVTNRYWTIVPEQQERFREQLKGLGVNVDD